MIQLRRGTYGIEYDDKPGPDLRRLWVPLVLVMVVVIPALFFRGCGKDGQEEKPEGELGSTRYRLPEVEAERERPLLLRHWFFSRRAREAASKPSDSAVAERGDDTAPAAAAATLAQPPQKLPPEVQRLMEQVAELENADDMPGARRILLHLLTRRDTDEIRAFAERKIGTLNTAMVFGDRPMPEKTRHKVASGEIISRLARNYGNTVDYILKVNGIDRPESLRAGREIWVLHNPAFELTVFKRAQKAVLTLNGQFFKSYEVRPGKSVALASGTYKVVRRVKNPVVSPQASSGAATNHELVLNRNDAATGLGIVSLQGATSEFNFSQPPDGAGVCFRKADIEEIFLFMRTGDSVNFAE